MIAARATSSSPRLWAAVAAALTLALVGSCTPSSAPPATFDNVLVIGWDGTRRAHLTELLRLGQLPHLQSLIDHGSFVALEVSRDATATKPGWSQLLSGYAADVTGVANNLFYRPIPAGLTVFERLQARYGKDGIATLFVGGKTNNIGARGPHRVCANCMNRYLDTGKKTAWWQSDTDAPLDPRAVAAGVTERLFVDREGEPWMHVARAIDLYDVGLGPSADVLPRALTALEQVRGRHFFAFFHFEEPDEQGHVFGESSQEYLDAIISNDANLGVIRDKLRLLGLGERTVIVVVSDHGMDEGTNDHSYAPSTFLATTVRNLAATGDRLDVAPTILELYGVDLKTLSPPLPGKSLLPRSHALRPPEPRRGQ